MFKTKSLVVLGRGFDASQVGSRVAALAGDRYSIGVTKCLRFVGPVRLEDIENGHRIHRNI